MAQKIIVLDGHALNPGDLSWDALGALGEVLFYAETPGREVAARSQGAGLVLTNKAPIGADTIDALPELRYIGVLATGYDIVDAGAAAKRGIPVSNIPAYGTSSVSQFVFALLLELCHRVQLHHEDVRRGGWVRRNVWSYHLTPQLELAGRRMGLIGFGRIGRQTGVIARAFGMSVIAADPALPSSEDGVESGSIEEVLRQSDIVSLHCPLTPETRGLMNRDRLSLMKPSAFLINTSRGPLIDENALSDALHSGQIAGAALDVLPVEPPVEQSPLISAPNCIVTPHIAWATREARSRLIEAAVENVRAFLSGKPVNVVNGVTLG